MCVSLRAKREERGGTDRGKKKGIMRERWEEDKVGAEKQMRVYGRRGG